MILVAGGSGHLGAELVPALKAAGHDVRVLTRDPDRTRALLDGSVGIAHGDVSRPESLAAAMKGVDTVVSAVTGFGPGGAGPRQVDYEGNVNLMNAAVAADVRHFVLVSIYQAGPDHPMELLREKHRAELELRSRPLRWTIVRPTVFMELWIGLLGDPILRSGKATIFGPGTNPVNFVSVVDLAQVMVRLISRPANGDEAIDVGGPQNLSFNELVRLIENASGRSARVTHVPVGAMRLSRILMRPWRPDVARLIEAGIATATTDMTFDSQQLLRRFPDLQRMTVEEVLGSRLAAV